MHTVDEPHPLLLLLTPAWSRSLTRTRCFSASASSYRPWWSHDTAGWRLQRV